MTKDELIEDLQEELEVAKQDRQDLVNEILKVWEEDNGSVQLHTPIAWYRVLRIAEKINKLR